MAEECVIFLCVGAADVRSGYATSSVVRSLEAFGLLRGCTVAIPCPECGQRATAEVFGRARPVAVCECGARVDLHFAVDLMADDLMRRVPEAPQRAAMAR